MERLTTAEIDTIKTALRTQIAINEGLLQQSNFYDKAKVAKWKHKVEASRHCLAKLEEIK